MKNKVEKINKSLSKIQVAEQEQFYAEVILPTIELLSFHVGYENTTALVQYHMSNPFGHFNGDLTRSTYTFYNFPNHHVGTSTAGSLEENEKRINDFIHNPSVVPPDVDNSYQAESLLAHLQHHIDVAHPVMIYDTLLAMSSKEKLVEDSLVTQLKLMTPLLNYKNFIELSFNSHTFPGEKVESEPTLHASSQQKIFAPYSLISMSGTLDRNEGYFSHESEEFKKAVFLNMFAKAFGKKVKMKYSLSQIMQRNSYFHTHQMWSMPPLNRSTHYNAKQFIIRAALLQKKPQAQTQEIMYNYLKAWHSQILETNYYKRYEKKELTRALSEMPNNTEAQTLPDKDKAPKKAPHKI